MYESVALSRLTSLKIGGVAKVITITGRDHLKMLTPDHIILGNGTNILASERIFSPVALIKLNDYAVSGECITADSGMPLATLSRIAAANSLTGLEWACGIPGTLGGAITMNAGAYGGQIADVIASVTTYRGGEFTALNSAQCGFSYRLSSVRGVIVGATLKLSRGDGERINAAMKEFTARRLASQPCGASAGSTYLKTNEKSAAYYIDRCGLKGAREGGAVVSEKHANFILNTGGATSRDVVTLMDRIERTVFDNYGITLKREIRLIGEF